MPDFVVGSPFGQGRDGRAVEVSDREDPAAVVAGGIVEHAELARRHTVACRLSYATVIRPTPQIA